MLRIRRLHNDDCDLRWCYDGTATGILGHVDCACLCHVRNKWLRWALFPLAILGVALLVMFA